MKIRILAASPALADMVAQRIEATAVEIRTAEVQDFLLRHTPAVDPTRVLRMLDPLAPPTRAEPLDDVDVELLLGDRRPLAHRNLVLVADSDDLAATLSSALERAGFRPPRTTVRPVESDAITCGDASPLVPSLLAWLLAGHGVNAPSVQQRGGNSQRITIEARDPRFQGTALLRNAVVEIRSDTVARGRAFARLCEAEGFVQVRLRRRDPVTEPGGIWSPGVLGRDPTIRARFAELVAHAGPSMRCVASAPDEAALIQLPAQESARAASSPPVNHASQPWPVTPPVPAALDELARLIARDACRLRLQLRTTCHAHRAALDALLAALPFAAFQVEHSPERANTITYGAAPEHVTDALARVVAAHTGLVCARDKAWDDDIDSIWIQLVDAAPAPPAPPAPPAAAPVPLLEREQDAVRIADLRLPVRTSANLSADDTEHLEGPVAEALHAAAQAVLQGVPFLLRGPCDSGRRVAIDTLARHTGHHIIQGNDMADMAAARAQDGWLLVIDPPAQPPAWLARTLAERWHYPGFRILGIADETWSGSWPAEHTMRTPTAQDIHDQLAAQVWGAPPVVTLAGDRYRAGAPGQAARPALASAGNASALLAGLATLYAALQTEPLRFGRRRLAALVDALRDSAPGAIQDALSRFVLGRFQESERARIRGLALAAGLGVAP